MLAGTKVSRPGWKRHERRIRHRMVNLGVRNIDISRATGMARCNVSAAIRGYTHSPYQIQLVFDYLGLELPACIKEELANRHINGKQRLKPVRHPLSEVPEYAGY